MKRSPLLAIWELRIKTAMEYHSLHTRSLEFETRNSKCYRGCGVNRIFIRCWRERKNGRTAAWPRKLNIHLSREPAITFLDTCPAGTAWVRVLEKFQNARNSGLYNSPRMATSQMSINRKMYYPKKGGTFRSALTMQMNKATLYAKTWMNFANTVLIKRRETAKKPLCDYMYTKLTCDVLSQVVVTTGDKWEVTERKATSVPCLPGLVIHSDVLTLLQFIWWYVIICALSY